MNKRRLIRLYKCLYLSPIGKLVFLSNGAQILKIVLEDEINLDDGDYLDKDLLEFKACKKWFDEYFSGQVPTQEIPIKLEGTKFQKQVWEILLKISYGKTMTYKEIALKIAKQNNMECMSAQAVGNAVNKNPLLIIIPCHRVLGSDNKLKGFRVGLDIKEKLLNIEKINYKR